MTDADKILPELTKISFTKTDLLRRIRILREYLEGKFFAGNKLTFGNFLKKSKCTQEDLRALSKLSNKFLGSFTKSNVYSLVSELVKRSESADSIHVYLPKQFPERDIFKLENWFKQNLGESTLIEIEVDPNLVLGFSFAINGVHHDFSYKYFWQKNRQDINKIVDDYVGKKNQ